MMEVGDLPQGRIPVNGSYSFDCSCFFKGSCYKSSSSISGGVNSMGPSQYLSQATAKVAREGRQLLAILFLGLLTGFAVLATPNHTSAQVAAGLLPPVPTEGSSTPDIQAVQEKLNPEEGPRPKELDIRLDFPRREDVFQVESEATFRARLRKEAEQRQIPIVFPKDAGPAPPPVGSFSTPFPPRQTLLVPSILCYRPLYFEEKNTERYGWTVPGLQPLISTGIFYLRTLQLPYSLAAQPPWSWECNTGYPLPGDPVPYSHYLLPSPWLPTWR